MKRDLRVHDHEPLLRATEKGLPCILLHITEPSMLEYPDSSLRHVQFQYHSVLDINQRENSHGFYVHHLYGECEEIFQYLATQFQIQELFSYQESGTTITWERDKTIAGFCKNHGIQWTEFQKGGVIRGIKNREQWEEMVWTCMCAYRRNTSNSALFNIGFAFSIPRYVARTIAGIPCGFSTGRRDQCLALFAFFFRKSRKTIP